MADDRRRFRYWCAGPPERLRVSLRWGVSPHQHRLRVAGRRPGGLPGVDLGAVHGGHRTGLRRVAGGVERPARLRTVLRSIGRPVGRFGGGDRGARRLRPAAYERPGDGTDEHQRGVPFHHPVGCPDQMVGGDNRHRRGGDPRDEHDHIGVKRFRQRRSRDDDLSP